MKNILITSAGKRVVLVKTFQKTLQEMGLDAKVYTVDLKPEMAPAGYVSEECIRVPRCTSDDYMDVLLQICIDKQIGVVIPTIDTELKVLSENRARFLEQGIQIVISDTAFIIMHFLSQSNGYEPKRISALSFIAFLICASGYTTPFLLNFLIARSSGNDLILAS